MSKGEQVWRFEVRIAGPDLNWRDDEISTGTLNLQTVLDEVRAFVPGEHDGNKWDFRLDNFVYRIRFEQ